MNDLLVVIPARSGSKGLPDKNIRIFRDKPLLAHSIEYGRQSVPGQQIFVSTDSEEYRLIAEINGAVVPELRPAILAQDNSKDYEFMSHAMELFDSIRPGRYKYYCLLRPTSPNRPAGLIEEGYRLLKTVPGASSVRSVIKASEHPYRCWTLDEEIIQPFVQGIHEPGNVPRQELPEVYFQSGHIEIVSRETLLGSSVSGSRVVPLLIDGDWNCDIDYEDDFLKAQELGDGSRLRR
jgi:N-acylneuraminate cytidylyltransferase